MSTKADAGILSAYGDYASELSKTIDYTTPAKAVAQGWSNLGGAGMNFAIIEQQRIEAERRAEEKRKKEEQLKKIKAWKQSMKGLPAEVQKQQEDHYSQVADLIYKGEITEEESNQDLDARTISNDNINAFKDEIAEIYEAEQRDGGVTDSFRLGNPDDIYENQTEEILGIFDGETEMMWNDETNTYGFMMNSKEKKIENETEIENLNAQLNELHDEYDFGGIMSHEDYINQWQEIENRVVELKDDINDGSKVWTSHHDIREMVIENSFDKSINNTITKISSDMYKIGFSGEGFDRESIRNGIVGQIIEEGRMRSLKEDPHLNLFDEDGEPRVWKDDMKEAIAKGPTGEGTTYEDLGLTPEIIMALDPTPPKGIIIGDDVDVIFNKIDNDDKLSRKFLADYFLNHYEKQHRKGVNAKKAREKKQEEESSSEASGMTGTIGPDGYWVPN